MMKIDEENGCLYARRSPSAHLRRTAPRAVHAFHEPAATATHFLSVRPHPLLQVALAPSMCRPNDFEGGRVQPSTLWACPTSW